MKTVKIEIPIGYEIDKEKSTFEKIVFKKIKSEWVDLGLPSGLIWADRNVGAETPQDNGLYFSWGNVDGHRADENGNTIDGYSFDNVTYYTTTLGSQYTGSTLDAEHDAATVNMGGNWRMPTIEEISELAKNTVHYYIGKDGSIVAGPFNYEASKDDKGLDGHKLRSICFVKKGVDFNYDNRSNFIEFPFASYCNGSSLNYDGLISGVWSNHTHKYVSIMANYLSFSNHGSICIFRIRQQT